jgi:basic membrane protein A and related proteins
VVLKGNCKVRRRLFQLISCLNLALFIGLGSIQAQQLNIKPIKVGFIMVGPLKDCGWDQAHNEGRLYVQSVLGKQVETTVVENVAEDSDAERVMERMIVQGNKLIFATSFGYMEPVLRVASRHPDVVFMQVNRAAYTKNVGTYSGYIDQPMYLAGMVAGRTTKTNRLGFVGGHPIPQIMQQINAYALGARSVNPKVKVSVVWINSWGDPPAESEAAKALIEKGADVLSTTNIFSTVLQVAETSGIYSVGLYGDQHKFLPRSWLTGSYYNWGPLYLKITKEVQNGVWKPNSSCYGMKDNCTKLVSFGSAVPKKVQQEVSLAEQRIKQGKLTVFQAPLSDRDGRERLAIGQLATAKWLSEMDWFVDGVEGTLPKH